MSAKFAARDQPLNWGDLCVESEENSLFDQGFTVLDVLRQIDPEQKYRDPRRTAFRCQVCLAPPEVLFPVLFARVEQCNEFTRLKVNAGYIWPFMKVATGTC